MADVPGEKKQASADHGSTTVDPVVREAAAEVPSGEVVPPEQGSPRSSLGSDRVPSLPSVDNGDDRVRFAARNQLPLEHC